MYVRIYIYIVYNAYVTGVLELMRWSRVGRSQRFQEEGQSTLSPPSSTSSHKCTPSRSNRAWSCSHFLTGKVQIRTVFRRKLLMHHPVQGVLR